MCHAIYLNFYVIIQLVFRHGNRQTKYRIKTLNYIKLKMNIFQNMDKKILLYLAKPTMNFVRMLMQKKIQCIFK